MARRKADGRFGVAEWYGALIEKTPAARLRAQAQIQAKKLSGFDCPFRQAASPGARCNKKGGVCTLRRHLPPKNGTVLTTPPLVTLCPSRFWQDNRVFKRIGTDILGVSEPDIVKEVQFLAALNVNDEDDEDDSAEEAVGRIDTILVDPDDQSRWCALELQAVYFSGDGMGSHLGQYKTTNQVPVYPDKNRRPDYRSSGPKRLMPQLQIKVPTLRRWGKKMAVVVDKPFFNSLGKMVKVNHLSNADIAWYVVDYDEKASLFVDTVVFTTLESSVEALTSGRPISKEAFETLVQQFLKGQTKRARSKVIRLRKPQPSPDGGSLTPDGAELPPEGQL